MDVEEPSKISFWDTHQSGPEAFENPERIKAINYWLAVAVAVATAAVFVAGATLHWSDEVAVEESPEVFANRIYPSGYGFVLLSAGAAAMGFLMGKVWKRPHLAIPLIWIMGVPCVLFGNWLAGQIFEGEFIYTIQWRAFQDVSLGPFIATVASFVSLSMYRFD